MPRLWGFVAVMGFSAASVVVACSSSDSADDTGGSSDAGSDVQNNASDGAGDALDPAATKACEDYVDAYCAKLRACQGYSPSCEAQKSLCPSYLFSSGSTLTPSDVSQCTIDLGGASCVDFFNNRPASCSKPGTRAAGSSCAFDSQCDSDKCINGVSHCGYCARIADDGESCEMQGVVCPHGKACDNNTGLCGPIPAPGSPCSEVNPPYVYCPSGLLCSRAPDQTADQTTCVPYAQPGQPCNVEPNGNYAYCDNTTGSCDLFDADVGAGNCVAYGNPGDPCGDNGSGMSVSCNGQNSYCEYGDGGTRGTCRALAAVGAACGPTGGSTYIQCDPGTSYCKLQTSGQPGVCTALLKAGDVCEPQPQLDVDGGPTGSTYQVACAPDTYCENYYCYFGFTQDAGPAQRQCVTGSQSGVAGDACGHGQCDTCAPSFACIDHVCVLPDLSSCN